MISMFDHICEPTLKMKLLSSHPFFPLGSSLNASSAALACGSVRPSLLGFYALVPAPDRDNAGFPPSDMGGRAQPHNVSMTFPRRSTPPRYRRRALPSCLPGSQYRHRQCARRSLSRPSLVTRMCLDSSTHLPSACPETRVLRCSVQSMPTFQPESDRK